MPPKRPRALTGSRVLIPSRGRKVFWSGAPSPAKIVPDEDEHPVFEVATIPDLKSDPSGAFMSRRKSIMGSKKSEADIRKNFTPLTRKNIEQHLHVVRGKDWKWGDEDGGEDGPGMILLFDVNEELATVFWQHSGIVQSHYRFGKFHDLATFDPQKLACLAIQDGLERRLQRNASSSAVTRLWNMVQRMTAMGQSEDAMTSKSSQCHFSEKSQTFIVFDWDDTLFPTHWTMNASGGYKLDPSLALRKQKHLSGAELGKVGRSLMQCAMGAAQLIRVAMSLGQVVVVTLADRGWVENGCSHFFPMVGDLMREGQIPIVYACEETPVDEEKVQHLLPSDVEILFGMVKAKAISRQLDRFYSQYEGQTWKNVVSIGDSQFERLGLKLAVAEHLKEKDVLCAGADDAGHLINIRTKTLKLMEKPTMEALSLQHEVVLRWLPAIARLDGHFDADLRDVEDPAQIASIESSLASREIVKSRSERSSGSSAIPSPDHSRRLQFVRSEDSMAESSKKEQSAEDVELGPVDPT